MQMLLVLIAVFIATSTAFHVAPFPVQVNKHTANFRSCSTPVPQSSRAHTHRATAVSMAADSFDQDKLRLIEIVSSTGTLEKHLVLRLNLTQLI
jgi:hypothetical protein